MTALKFPIEEIIKFGKENNILTIIDGAHAPGHIPLNLKKLDPDIYTGACHKWMCSPKGVSFLYVKKNLQEKIHPLVISWGWKNELSNTSRFLDWHQWQGTRDMSAFLTIPTVIKFLEKNNWTHISSNCKNLVINTRKKILEYLDIDPLCPDSWLGQMASIPIPFKDPQKIKNLLISHYKIQVPVFEWNNQTYLRYSIQGYNTQSDVDILFSAIKEITS
tara:strand:- start:288 stop:944 length:657 start_codon:yes stop_codon:yes gene_type:complete